MTLLTVINFSALAKLALLDLTLGVNNAALIVPSCLSVPTALRRRAMVFGTAGAIAARAVMLALATLLVGLPGVDIAAGLYLLFGGYQILVAHDADGNRVAPHLGVWNGARAIALADVAMSVDNVLAVASAAHILPAHSTAYAVAAVCFTIPAIMFGSGILARFVHRHPVFAVAGSALLGYIGVDIVIADPLLAKYVTWTTLDFLGFSVPVAVLGSIAVVQAALLTRRRAEQRLAQGEPNS
ncbi:hypothetical protein AB4Y45_34140 [Paraburkholderia sp. EG287A]|uniref:TerC family protein n=1 Tax=Paraburkholderia sp. EG287A TaxID=3237012 RepID=UPI0034D22E4B